MPKISDRFVSNSSDAAIGRAPLGTRATARPAAAFLMTCACAFFSGCALQTGFSIPWSEPAVSEPSKPVEEKTSTARVEIVPLDDARGTVSDVEIMWHIPREPVEGFIVRYGFERSNMNEESRVLTKDLEQLDHPQHGPVYRFVLGNIPVDKPIYISIAAFTGDRISRASDVFEVKAEKK